MATDMYGDRDRIQIFKDKAGEYRWRYLAANNGEVMADSGEGYGEEGACLDGATRVTGRQVVYADTATFSLTAAVIQGVFVE